MDGLEVELKGLKVELNSKVDEILTAIAHISSARPGRHVHLCFRENNTGVPESFMFLAETDNIKKSGKKIQEISPRLVTRSLGPQLVTRILGLEG